MRIFDAHIYALLLKTHIYGGTKHAYICVQNTIIFAYETRIYQRTSELRFELVMPANKTKDIDFDQKTRRKARRNGELLQYIALILTV